jgi:predicted peptidase
VRRLRPLLLACSLALCAAVVAAASADLRPAASPFQVRHLRLKGDSVAYAVWLPPGYERSRAWPCIVFLNGSGECGTDGLKQTWQGIGPELIARPERWPFVVVMPQKPRDDEEWEEHEDLVFGALEAVRKDGRLDMDRVALTGISQGGHGAWTIGARHAERWSCLVPVCGYGRALTVASRIARLPVWAFQGAKDDVVDPRETRDIVADLARRAQAQGSPEPRFTLYADLGHGCWAAAFADSALPAWILAQKRGR